MIFLPVKPESPWGPPITNLPDGLIKIIVLSSGLISSDSKIESITNFFKSFLMISWTFWLSEIPFILGLCWVDNKTVWILEGFPSTYSTVTCDLPSGLK